MLLEEEKKAIEDLKDFKSISILYGNTFTIFLEQLKKYQEATDTVLNLIEKLKKENEKLKEENISLFEDLKNWKKLNGEKNRQLLILNKQIDLMAEYMFNKNKAQLIIEYGIENKEQFIEKIEKLAKEKGE